MTGEGDDNNNEKELDRFVGPRPWFDPQDVPLARGKEAILKTVNCPRCGGRGLRIVWGMLPYEAHKKCEADPDLTPGGCCIDPGVSHHCERCEHRWLVDGFGVFDAVSTAGPETGGEGSLWVVGDRNGDGVLSAQEWPEDDTFVWLETEPANRMTLYEFDLAQGEGVVGWLAEPEPYED